MVQDMFPSKASTAMASEPRLHIVFSGIRTGFGNNGGTKTIFHCADTLADLGHQVTLVSDVRSRFSWFRPAARVVRSSTLPDDADAVIATGVQSARHLAKAPGGFLKAWYIRAWETWQAKEAELVRLCQSGLLLLVNAEWLQDAIRRKAGAGSRLVYPGLDVDTLFPERSDEPAGTVTIGGIHNPRKLKRFGSWVSVVRNVMDQRPECRAALFGDGGPPKTHFACDYVRRPSRPQLRAMLNSCDIWLATSSSEGLHCPPMEAGLCGCALVATDIGGMSDYAVHGATALTAPVNDLDAHVSHVVALIDDAEERHRLADGLRTLLLTKIGTRRENMSRLAAFLAGQIPARRPTGRHVSQASGRGASGAEGRLTVVVNRSDGYAVPLDTGVSIARGALARRVCAEVDVCLIESSGDEVHIPPDAPEPIRYVSCAEVIQSPPSDALVVIGDSEPWRSAWIQLRQGSWRGVRSVLCTVPGPDEQALHQQAGRCDPGQELYDERLSMGPLADDRVFGGCHAKKRQHLVVVPAWELLCGDVDPVLGALGRIDYRSLRVAIVGRPADAGPETPWPPTVADGPHQIEWLSRGSPAELNQLYGTTKIALLPVLRTNTWRTTAAEILLAGRPICFGNDYADYPRYANEHTGVVAGSDDLPARVAELVQGHRRFHPHRYARQHFGLTRAVDRIAQALRPSPSLAASVRREAPEGLRLLMLRAEITKENRARVKRDRLDDVDDMWTLLWERVARHPQVAEAEVWYWGGERVVEYRPGFTERWLRSFKHPPDFRPDVLFTRGGFKQYDTVCRRFPEAFKVYYGAGVRFLPPKGGYRDYDLLLVDSRRQLADARKRLPHVRAELLVKPAADTVFRPHDVEKRYDVSFVTSSDQPSKRLGLLLRQLARLDGVSLLIVGPVSGKTRREAQKLGLDATFTGWLPRRKAARHMSLCRVGVVCSSTRESCPRVIPEHLACDVPLVLTDNIHLWTDRYVSDHTALICPDAALAWTVEVALSRLSQFAPAAYYRAHLSLDVAAGHLWSLLPVGAPSMPSGLGPAEGPPT